MMVTVCDVNKCAGCMACVDVCQKNAIKVIDDLKSYNAVVQEEKCINCNACHRVCPSIGAGSYQQPLKWHQGWTEDIKIRAQSSSGGAAHEISKAFIKKGGCVCSCTFVKGEFLFEIVDTVSDLYKFAGSKYVKSNPKGVYQNISNKLKEGRKVLFIGLPCQVSAIKKYTKDNELLYTIDLICHGSSSPKVLEMFLNQYNYSLKTIKSIDFRMKNDPNLYQNRKTITQKGIRDRYLLAFLNSLIYTDNCYECKYARIERVSDITLGDSWGSELSLEEQRRGISLILSQSSKGNEILKDAALNLENVDVQKAVEYNHQLSYPPQSPPNRNHFWKGIAQKKKFNNVVKQSLPKQCRRQDIKIILTRLGIIGKNDKDSIDYRIAFTLKH